MARLSQAQVARLRGLLDVLYKPGEIAEKLGVEVRTIYRSHIPAGAPVRRDEAGRMWIPGVAYRDWARDVLQRRRASQPKAMSLAEGYCVKCNRMVEMVDAHRREKVDRVRGIGMISGRCPVCRGKVNRFFKLGEVANDPAEEL